MSSESALRDGRALAETLMVDTCTVTRQSGTTTDSVTLAETATYGPVWSGPCRIQRGRGQIRDVTGGGVEYGVGVIVAQLPIAAAGIRRGDRIEVTAVGGGTDPALAGLVATVQEDLSKTHATRRTLICEEVTT